MSYHSLGIIYYNKQKSETLNTGLCPDSKNEENQPTIRVDFQLEKDLKLTNNEYNLQQYNCDYLKNRLLFKKHTEITQDYIDNIYKEYLTCIKKINNIK